MSPAQSRRAAYRYRRSASLFAAVLMSAGLVCLIAGSITLGVVLMAAGLLMGRIQRRG